MTEAAHVRGQVWRPDGHAASDAVVTLTDPRGAQVGSTAAGANGAFSVPLPGPGRYVMVVAAPRHAPWVRYVTAAGADVEMPVVLTGPAPEQATQETFPAFARQPPPAPSEASAAPRPQPAAPQAPRAFTVPPTPPATHVASTPEGGFPASDPAQDGRALERARRQDETTAVAAQTVLSALAEGRPLPPNSLYGLVTALLAGRIDLETDPDSALARTAARLGGVRGAGLAETQDAADAILTPLARQLLTDEPADRPTDAAAPENVIALLRPLIEALATDLESRAPR